jgi:DNA-binding CsgD family transcriptional regulator
MNDVTTVHPPLSPAELAAFKLKASGLTRKQVALQLGKSPETVKKQLASVMLKLGAPDMQSAIGMGVDLGIVAARRYQGTSTYQY